MLFCRINTVSFPRQRIETLEVTLATPEEAELLQIPVGSPLLLNERTLWSQDRKAVEFVSILYRGDRYKIFRAPDTQFLACAVILKRYWGFSAAGCGQAASKTANAFPIMLLSGTYPQTCESADGLRLSPRTKYSPLGTSHTPS